MLVSLNRTENTGGDIVQVDMPMSDDPIMGGSQRNVTDSLEGKTILSVQELHRRHRPEHANHAANGACVDHTLKSWTIEAVQRIAHTICADLRVLVSRCHVVNGRDGSVGLSEHPVVFSYSILSLRARADREAPRSTGQRR